MEIAVLIKAVPALEELRFDPGRRTAVREGSRLRTNPLDGRALAVALALRRPGERVVALSLGPPGAVSTLREALALGADRAVLVEDRCLAGSDALVTGRVLARALGEVGHTLVLAGRASTDSETGVVGAMVAALLSASYVGPARAVGRGEAGAPLEVATEVESGVQRFRVPLPAVVAVGEKILKPGRVSPEALDGVAADAVERWDARRLKLLPEEVGLAGSPTVVAELEDAPPARTPRVLVGSAPEIARAAAAFLSENARTAPSVVSRLAPFTGPRPEARETLVLASDGRGGAGAEILPLLSEVRRYGGWPGALWVGPPPIPSEALALSRAGALALYHSRGEAYVEPQQCARVAEELLSRRREVEAVLALSDPYGRAVLGALAARQGIGIVGDAIAIERASDGRLRGRKPTFGRSLTATIALRSRPALFTVREGSFLPGEVPDPVALRLEELPPPPVASRTEFLGESLRSEPAEYGDLARARTVLVVGMGLGGPDRLGLLLPTLRRWGAALAATRRVVDAEWVSPGRQVGLTGRNISPDVALLIGVSGSPNHLVGLRRSRRIVAINRDDQAPVFRECDLGLVGEWEELLPALAEAWPGLGPG